MRFFGLYFAFFSFAFSYLFKGNAALAAQFGADMLFLYFAFTSAFTMSVAVLLFVALKKGLRFAAISPFFGGLFAGAAGIFFATLLANRLVLLLGAYLLGEAVKNSDMYAAGIGAVFLVFGYFVFRPFNFDFMGTKKAQYEQPQQRTDDGTIDAEVVEDFDKLERK